MASIEESTQTNTVLNPLKEPPFGLNSLGEHITEVSGVWVSSAIQLLNETPKITQGNNRLSPVDLLLNAIHKLVPPGYAAILDESFLVSRFNFYSAEFGFTLAALCRIIGGAGHTKEATNRILITSPEEALPLEWLDSAAPILINEGLLGGKVFFRKVDMKGNASFDVIYPASVKSIGNWKDIAYDQQDARIIKVLKTFWGLHNIYLQALGRYEKHQTGEYGFEYKITWEGGEKSPSQGILGTGSGSLNDFIKRKSSIWFNYLSSMQKETAKESQDTILQALALKSKSQDEYESVKDIVEEQGKTIDALRAANYELEGMIHFLSAKEEKLKEESSTWKASKVASDQLKRQAEEMAQIKSKLMSMVSHELRTPLSSLLGFTELLLEGDFEPEQIREFLLTIHTESARMKELLDEFLDMQRLQSGRIELKPETCDFNEILKHVISTFKGYASGVNIVTSIPPTLPQINADRSKLEQILKNFISNAIKYSPNGGDVRVFVSHDESMATICVADQGLGIPEESLTKLFQEFYRVERETHANIKGTGLGLSITKELIEAHGGKVWVKSKLGVGSQFFFSIPLADSQK
jgi:signal transduction histidine kinase